MLEKTIQKDTQTHWGFNCCSKRKYAAKSLTIKL